MKVSFGKYGTWKELPVSISISDTQVKIIWKLSPDTGNWRAQNNFTEDLCIMAVHEFGKNKWKYLPPGIDSEGWKIKNLLYNNINEVTLKKLLRLPNKNAW